MEQQAARIEELEQEVEQPREAKEELADMPSFTLDQAIESLIDQLKDEAPKALQAKFKNIANRLQQAWTQRRRDGVPTSPELAPKKSARGKSKKDRTQEVLDEAASRINNVLGGLMSGESD